MNALPKYVVTTTLTEGTWHPTTVLRGDPALFPFADYFLPVLVGVSAALLLFFVQKDLGPALLLCCVFLAAYAVARGRSGMAVLGLGLMALGFYVGYLLHVSSTLTGRVRMWLSPWDNAAAGGDQVAHAIWALATGGAAGVQMLLDDLAGELREALSLAGCRSCDDVTSDLVHLGSWPPARPRP